MATAGSRAFLKHASRGNGGGKFESGDQARCAPNPRQRFRETARSLHKEAFFSAEYNFSLQKLSLKKVEALASECVLLQDNIIRRRLKSVTVSLLSKRTLELKTLILNPCS
jgi:hypothetical protein